MKTFKCDGCSKYYDEIPKIKYKSASGTSMDRKVTGIVIRFDDNMSDLAFDLCYDCARKIMADVNILTGGA